VYSEAAGEDELVQPYPRHGVDSRVAGVFSTAVEEDGIAHL